MFGNFELLIEQSKNYILRGNYKRAKKTLDLAFKIKNDSPKIHNILGIIAEIQKSKALAAKHYRAALGLDASYKPAIKNLEKITDYEYYYKVGNLYFD